MYTNFESGRSMVEMLGVLAVVGVLSVAGIAAYNNAMNKYRANEILNEASKRATIVAMQFASGRTTGSLAEFTNNDLGYAVFASETAPGDNENQFKLILETPPVSAVCVQMKNQVGSASVIRKIATDCSALSYNKDLSTTSYASDFNNETDCKGAGKKWCSDWDSPACAEDCCAQRQDQDLCDFQAQNDGFCENKTCLKRTVCIDDDDCKLIDSDNCAAGGCFCDYSSVGDYGPRSGRDYGTCLKAEDYALTNAGTPLVASKKTMTWFSAVHFCKALGKELVPVESMGCYDNGGALIEEGSSLDVSNPKRSCCKENTDCANKWATDKSLYSDKLVALFNLIQGNQDDPLDWTQGKYAFYSGSYWNAVKPNQSNKVYTFDLYVTNDRGTIWSGFVFYSNGARAVCE